MRGWYANKYRAFQFKNQKLDPADFIFFPKVNSTTKLASLVLCYVSTTFIFTFCDDVGFLSTLVAVVLWYDFLSLTLRFFSSYPRREEFLNALSSPTTWIVVSTKLEDNPNNDVTSLNFCSSSPLFGWILRAWVTSIKAKLCLLSSNAATALLKEAFAFCIIT